LAYTLQSRHQPPFEVWLIATRLLSDVYSGLAARLLSLPVLGRRVEFEHGLKGRATEQAAFECQIGLEWTAIGTPTTPIVFRARSQIPRPYSGRGSLPEILKRRLEPRIGMAAAMVAQIGQEAALGIQLRSGAELHHQSVGRDSVDQYPLHACTLLEPATLDHVVAEADLPHRTTIGEGRQHGVAGTANRIKVLSDQPFDVCPGLRDAAENLTAASFRFDIANPYIKATFSVLAAPYEGGIRSDRDRRRRCRGPDRGTVSKRAPAFRVWRRKVLESMPASTGNRLWCKLSNSVVNPDLRSVHGVLVY
jgi:hypothetical protein